MQALNRFAALHQSCWPSMEALILETISAVCPQTSLLYQMTVYQMKTGGKRLRAILPLLVAEAMTGGHMRLLAFGAACEAIHNASVVHDDLQDGDSVRRGQLAVWSRFGRSQAVNLGDALLGCAFSLVQKLDVVADVRERITGQMLLQLLRVCDGQVRDVELKASQSACVADYLRVTEAKTAGFFALPISGAAMLCGADEIVQRGLREAASHLGVLFQVQDDVVDTLAKPADCTVCHDLINGNRNTLIVHCLVTAEDQDRQWLQRLLDKPAGDTTYEEVALAQKLMERTGSIDFAFAEIRSRHAAALAVPILQQFPKLGEVIDGACRFCLSGLEFVAGTNQLHLGSQALSSTGKSV